MGIKRYEMDGFDCESCNMQEDLNGAFVSIDDVKNILYRIKRAHDACATPARPRQHVGEMLEAILTDYGINDEGT